MSFKFYRNNLLGCLGALFLIVGCKKADPPEFRLNMVQMVSAETPTSPEYQQEIADVLGALFGTPDEPFALPETGLEVKQLQMAAGAAWSDIKGASHGLYRRHCVHCHGITGDGRGPTARFLNPYPRDYRQAVYKFKSTYNASRPTDEDLHKILIDGVPGTAMPSFSLLPSSETDALVEYVKYLSMRGQMEVALIGYVYNDLGEEEAEDENGDPVLDDAGEPVILRIPFDPVNDPEQYDAVMELLTEIVDDWNSAAENIIAPNEEYIPAEDRADEQLAASVTKGRELFYGTKANCIKCHGPTALGDGQQDDFDNWNKAHKKFLDDLAKGQEREQGEEDQAFSSSRNEVASRLYPTRNAIPRNLRKGIYRGGRRRLDVFWRIYAGIPGTPMPATGPASAGAKGTLTEEEMWDLVDYVLSLPYEPPSRPLKALPVNTDEVL